MDDAHLDLDHENVGSILIVSEVVNDHKDHNNADSDDDDDDHDDGDDDDDEDDVDDEADEYFSDCNE